MPAGPPRVVVTAVEPWAVTYNEWFAVDPAQLGTKSNQWNYLVEDLVQIAGPGGLLVDLGWYPDSSPDGAFVARLIRNTEWQAPVAEIEAHSIASALTALNELMTHQDDALGQLRSATQPTPAKRHMTLHEKIDLLVGLYSDRRSAQAEVTATSRPTGVWIHPRDASAYLKVALERDSTAEYLPIPAGIAVVVTPEGERAATHVRVVRDTFGSLAALYADIHD